MTWPSSCAMVATRDIGSRSMELRIATTFSDTLFRPMASLVRMDVKAGCPCAVVGTPGRQGFFETFCFIREYLKGDAAAVDLHVAGRRRPSSFSRRLNPLLTHRRSSSRTGSLAVIQDMGVPIDRGDSTRCRPFCGRGRPHHTGA